jgi:hypothetical protein
MNATALVQWQLVKKKEFTDHLNGRRWLYKKDFVNELNTKLLL